MNSRMDCNWIIFNSNYFNRLYYQPHSTVKKSQKSRPKNKIEDDIKHVVVGKSNSLSGKNHVYDEYEGG